MFEGLEKFESRTFSQNGEDGILKRIFELIGTTNRYFVEFGCGADSRQCNARLLHDRNGWQGLWMDLGAPADSQRVRKERITAENINELFAKYQVPAEFDLFSLDIDGNDYWVFRAIDEKYRPRVIVAEYNSKIPSNESKAIAYNPDHCWERTDYFGVSLLALTRLAKRRGYKLVYCELCGINAFFVRDDLAPNWDVPMEKLFRKPNYAYRVPFGFLFWPKGAGHKTDKHRRMIDVEAE